MANEEIISAMQAANKWWRGELQLDFKPRHIYYEMQKFLPERQIMALVGLRRTGKTTILLKIVQDHLATLGRENIIYFSFDEFKAVKLRLILQEYSRLMGKRLDIGRYMFLFDEIQKLEGWEEQLKSLYDTYPNIKFLISGSESLFIRKKLRESLAGRMYEFHIKTLSFKEYLDFKAVDYHNIGLAKGDIISELPLFFLSNGFPEIIGKEKEIAVKYVKENVIEKIIYRDIPQVVPIKEPATLEQLLKIILANPGEIINLDSLSGELNVTRQTISTYMGYLEKSFLIRKLYNFSRNARKTQRKAKKYYPTIINPNMTDWHDYFGKIFETFVVNELDAEFFWRDAYKNEIDIVKTDPLTAIEIKSGKVSKEDARAIKSFSRKFAPKAGLILSYDTEGTVEGLPVVPFYKYLLDT